MGSRSHLDDYEGRGIDNFLETSYVEFEDLQERKARDSNYLCNTGASFFQRSNYLYCSEVGNKERRMINKKTQCDIGSGASGISFEATFRAQSKKEQLHMLKMIKLLRLVFRSLRSQKDKMKEDVLN